MADIIPLAPKLIARDRARGVDPATRARRLRSDVRTGRTRLKALAGRTRNGCCVRSHGNIYLEHAAGEMISAVWNDCSAYRELFRFAERCGLVLSAPDLWSDGLRGSVEQLGPDCKLTSYHRFADRELDRVYLIATEPVALSLDLLRDRRLSRPVDVLLQVGLARLERRGQTWHLIPGSGTLRAITGRAAGKG